MRLDILNLQVELDKELPNLQAALDNFQYGFPADFKQRFVREGSLLKTVGTTHGTKIPHGLWVINFETRAVPAQRSITPDDGKTIRSICLTYMGDKSILPDRRHTKAHLILKETHRIDSQRIVEKIIDFTKLYMKGVKDRDAKILEIANAKIAAELAVKSLEERRKRMKESAGKRSEVFDQLVETLKETGKIESQLPGGYLNLALKNNVKVKITVDTDRVFISEIETPMAFTSTKMEEILGVLKKIELL